MNRQSLYDEIVEILKVQDIPRISFGSKFSKVFRPLRNYVRASSREYDYAFAAESQHPAYLDPMTSSIAFVEDALKTSQRVAKNLGLNGPRFRRLYSLGSWVNEFRHWKDMINEDSCAPLLSKFQGDMWLMCTHVALVGSETLETGGTSLKEPSGSPFSFRSGPMAVYPPITASTLWTETIALDEERRLFKASKSEEAEILSRLCNMESSEKPCSQIPGCAVHELASFLAEALRAKFGSLQVLERMIREKVVAGRTIGQGMGSPDYSMLTLLTLDDSQIRGESLDFQLMREVTQRQQKEFIFWTKRDHEKGVLAEALRKSPEEIWSKVSLALLVGRLRDALRSTISIERLEDEKLYGRIYVEKRLWDILKPKEKRLCFDLFGLRLDVSHALSCCSVMRFKCKKKKRCPVIHTVDSGELHMRDSALYVDATLNSSLDYIKEKHSQIPSQISDYYEGNRRYFERTRKSILKEQKHSVRTN